MSRYKKRSGGRGGSSSAFSNQKKGGGRFNSSSSGSDSTFNSISLSTSYRSERTKARDREIQQLEEAELDRKFGFDIYTETTTITAFLFNLRTSTLPPPPSSSSLPPATSCLDCYFISSTGRTFKALLAPSPYFYLLLSSTSTADLLETEQYLLRRFEGVLLSVSNVNRIDLSQLNHLSGLERIYLKLSFRNVNDLVNVRNILLPVINKNKKFLEEKSSTSLTILNPNVMDEQSSKLKDRRKRDSILDLFIDIREYDVPYLTRVCIDLNIRCGCWYDITLLPSTSPSLHPTHQFNPRPDLLTPPPLKKLAFDIETTKDPLKFPQASHDQIMMISMMCDGEGVLIVNREIVSDDISDFEYAPTPEIRGDFTIYNVTNEKQVLLTFIEYIVKEKPLIYVTYNGDYFDWPFINARCQQYGLSLNKLIGVTERDGEYMGKFSIHLDCFCWVQRDSYLPQGSQGLKAVTKAKLKYNPVELDPELMLTYASERPHDLAAYSVSDAVSTYYLYMKYIHFFIFSLATIIPLNPADVLRKGSGTLCENLLMAKATECNIIAPNKQEENTLASHNGFILESETYIGGHVECIESGVFREDLPVKFRIKPERIKELIEEVEETIGFTIKELKFNKDEITNYEVLVNNISNSLLQLLATPTITSLPLIYHLDVGAMYPNIILTNRLQPHACVTESVCAACIYQTEDGANCQREMDWQWRGKHFLPTKNEVESVRNRLEVENMKDENNLPITYSSLPLTQQHQLLKQRLKNYSQTTYKAVTKETVEKRSSIVCQREHPFYVDTVRAFRDRRYEYKTLGKKAKSSYEAAKTALEKEKATDIVLLYDSLQLAHKCILNSFYGYVMRKGARWHSMEMAGIVTNTGADLIKDARAVLDDIGRPLELDTDGVWTMLPSIFPDNYSFHLSSGKSISWSYPCAMLNLRVAKKYTNHQFQEQKDAPYSNQYVITPECSIQFEIDGPYRAMILPSSKEENKNIKKRYAVFNKDGSLAELKGFEIKRRGELQLIKIFQGAIFDSFLKGDTLEQCYESVGSICNYWLDILVNRGSEMTDDDILELLAEAKNMSEKIEAYEDRKSTSITTARRLADFLGADMLADKGLNCSYIIAALPAGTSTSERAIPTAIFQAESSIQHQYLKKWCKASGEAVELRELIDWSYYIERLSAAIMKIVTIPAAMQGISNPVQRVKHPDWLHKRVRERDDTVRQARLDGYFTAGQQNENIEPDMEDLLGSGFKTPLRRKYAVVKRKGKKNSTAEENKEEIAQEAEGERQNTVSEIDMKEAEEEKKDENEKKQDSVEHNEMDLTSDNTDINVLQTPLPANNRKPKPKSPSLPPPLPAVPLIEPDMNTDFDAWLIWQKNEWALQKERRREKRMNSAMQSLSQSLSNNNKNGGKPLTGGMDGWMKKAREMLTSAVWQVVQVTEVGPGMFLLHILVPSGMTTVTIHVQRHIFINVPSNSSTVINEGRIVNRILPHGKQANQLYEVVIKNEDELVNLLPIYKGWEGDGDVEGVYETDISLLFRVLVEIGCVCRLDKRAVSPYTLASLSMTSTLTSPYLASPLTRCYLYISKPASFSDNRQVILMLPEGNDTGICIVVNPYRGGGNGNARGAAVGDGGMGTVNTQKLWRECELEAMGQNANDNESGSGSQVVASGVSFTVQVVDTADAAYSLLREELVEAKTKAPHPFLICLQSTHSLFYHYSHLPSLQHDYPVISLPLTSDDGNYPAFTWLQYACKRGMSRYWFVGTWWDESLAMCRYGHLPIGNIGETSISQLVIDVFFARRLIQSHHLLWKPQPFSSNNHTIVQYSNSNTNLVNKHEHINNQGTYRHTCIDLTISHLILNSILQSSYLEEEDDLLLPTLRVLRSCVRDWYQLCIGGNNMYCTEADSLLTSFHSWLLCQFTYLYDESLLNYIYNCMNKCFIALTNKMIKIGCTVIYATYNRLLLHIQKDNIQVDTYMTFLISHIKKEDLLLYVDMSLAHVWGSLIWLDAANFGGLIQEDNKNGTENETPLANRNNDIVGLGSMKVYYMWNIADYLPPICQRYFIVIMTEYLILPYKEQQRLLSHLTLPPSTPKAAVITSQKKDIPPVLSLQQRENAFVSYMQNLIFNHFTDRLLRLISDVRSTNEINTRTLGLIYPPDVTPALALTRSLLHILSMEPIIINEIRRMRESLMKLLLLHSFSAQSYFIDPCNTVIVPLYPCTNCQMLMSYDLCRDENCIEKKYACIYCNYSIGVKERIEYWCIEQINDKIKKYNQQDLICKECGRVKESHLGLYCPCSGEYVNSISLTRINQDLKVYENVAEYHQFEWLKEVVEGIKQN